MGIKIKNNIRWKSKKGDWAFFKRTSFWFSLIFMLSVMSMFDFLFSYAFGEGSIGFWVSRSIVLVLLILFVYHKIHNFFVDMFKEKTPKFKAPIQITWNSTK